MRTMGSKSTGKKFWAKQDANIFRKGCYIKKNN